MKVSIILTFYNKQNCNRNTIYSILRQKTNFPFEVLIVNDNSPNDDFSYLSKIKKPLNITLKYKKNETNMGSNFGHQTALGMMDDDVDIIVTQSSDVLYATEYTLQKLVDGVDDNHYTSGAVANMKIDTNLWKNMENELPKIVDKMWPKMENPKTKYMYTSSKNPRLYWFLAAIKKDHLFKYFTWRENACDVKTKEELIKLNKDGKLFVRWIDDAMAIHQKHPQVIHPCPIVDVCKFKCPRKRDKK
jgi:glycosyltransferase involved in cell wall biosynthesis